MSGFLAQYGYHGFLAVGAISMLVLTVWRRKEYGLPLASAIIFPLLLLICGVSGAKLLYFLESGLSSFGGMSFFGAVYLVLLVMPLIGLFFRLKPLQTLDICAPCVASIIGFMRFGCFCARCCGGTLTPFGFHWPTQLLEGFGDMLILAYLLSCEQRGDKRGQLYPLFLLNYGTIRFAIEFLRDTQKNMFGLSEGQWLALIGMAIGAIFLITNNRYNYKHKGNTQSKEYAISKGGRL